MYKYYIMKISELNLKLSADVARHSLLDSHWGGLDLPPEPYCRIYLPLSGNAGFTVKGKRYDMQPGNIYLIPSGCRMQTHCEALFDIVWIHFYAKVFNSVDVFSIFECSSCHTATVLEKELMLRLVDFEKKADDIGELAAQGILIYLAAGFLGDAVVSPGFIRFMPLLKYIEENLNRRIKITELAGRCRMSAAYFSTTFKEVTGMAPQEYIMTGKLNAARNMLLSGDTLDEIAEKLSFYDAFHLSKAFVKHFGRSPRKYRREFFNERMP